VQDQAGSRRELGREHQRLVLPRLGAPRQRVHHDREIVFEGQRVTRVGQQQGAAARGLEEGRPIGPTGKERARAAPVERRSATSEDHDDLPRRQDRPGRKRVAQRERVAERPTAHVEVAAGEVSDLDELVVELVYLPIAVGVSLDEVELRVGEDLVDHGIRERGTGLGEWRCEHRHREGGQPEKTDPATRSRPGLERKPHGLLLTAFPAQMPPS